VATFLKQVHDPHDKKEVQWHSAQVAAQKYVEQAFGILQNLFAIVRGLTRLWYQEDLWYSLRINKGNIRCTTSTTWWANRFGHGVVEITLSASFKHTITFVIQMCMRSFKPISWKSRGTRRTIQTTSSISLPCCLSVEWCGTLMNYLVNYLWCDVM
jgi:hypothetical protein